MMAIDFSGQVAIVTGAGNGLGRSHALALARRGAHVVVNDAGLARDGASVTDSPAEAVAAEIVAMGGEAMADHASVTDGNAMAEMAERARERWGRIDMLIANAGILRDSSFSKMSFEDFRDVVDVHLNGAFHAAKAVWDVMREQQYGRLLFTSSAAGMFGNFGQANYSAAKMGLVGLARTLSLEGARYGIRINVLAPLAATRMLADLLPEDILERLDPEHASAMALYLCSPEAPTGMICGAGGGVYHGVHVSMTEGVRLPIETRTAEGIAAAFSRIMARGTDAVPRSGSDQLAMILKKLRDEPVDRKV